MLVLGEQLTDLDGTSHPMAGLLPFTAQRGPLQVGYRRLQARRDSPVVESGQQLVGHEFHRWELHTNRPSSDRWCCGTLWDGKSIDIRKDGSIRRFTRAGFTCTGKLYDDLLPMSAALESGERRSPNASSAASSPRGSNPSPNAGAG